MRCVRPLRRHMVGSTLQADPPTVVGGHRDPLVVGVPLGPAGQLAVERGQRAMSGASRTAVLSFPIAIRSSSPTDTTNPAATSTAPPRTSPADSAGPSLCLSPRGLARTAPTEKPIRAVPRLAWNTRGLAGMSAQYPSGTGCWRRLP
jgi:hypothetical protein